MLWLAQHCLSVNIWRYKMSWHFVFIPLPYSAAAAAAAAAAATKSCSCQFVVGLFSIAVTKPVGTILSKLCCLTKMCWGYCVSMVVWSIVKVFLLLMTMLLIIDSFYCVYSFSSCSTRKVSIVNFCLSKHLFPSEEKLTDQRGSLAYVSPDILSGQ